MANIKELIQSIEAADSSFDEKLAAINQMEETLVAMRQQEETAVQENVDLIVEAIKVMEDKVNAQLEIAKSIVPEKGDKGDKGLDGKQGKDGRDGKDGKDGINGKDGADGKDGVSVTDAKIDFDGSLIISLSTGQEINVGEVVAPELQEKIKLVTSGGAGTVLPSQTGNANKYLKTDGTALSWATVSGGSGTVTSVATSGTVNGITLTGGPITSSGTVTLGGTLDLSSPPTIGNTAPNTGAFTTLSASSTVSGTGFSTYLASPPAIGGTSPAAVTATTLIGGGGSANYGQLTGGATTKAVEFQTLGSDSNIALVLDTKGTGAIDLAAGSSGVNISNGGTVTAITRTAAGSAYTAFPNITLSAPTTSGGVQATASVALMIANAATIQSGGTGYTLNDVVTLSGGTPSVAATFTVTAVSSGVVTAVSSTNFGTYSVLPSNPVSVTGGTGTGLTLNVTWAVGTSFTISNAGSGYVEQPTITFSSGSATAYATVGSGTIIRSLGSTSTQSLDFYTPQGITSSIPAMRIRDSASDSYPMVNNLSGLATFVAQGNSTASLGLASNGSGNVRFYTNGTTFTEQMRVSHTASAVNYVQVTGSATTLFPNISAQGSDTNIGLTFASKGSQAIRFNTNTSDQQFRVTHTASAVNYVQVSGNIAGSAPRILSEGSDTNIDLTLTPKGTGNVRFGTYTANMALTIQGYIEIKDSGGTTRRLAVIA